MEATANGIHINYELSGEGPCLVLIHGFSDNLAMWYNQVPEFSKRCKVLAYDVRGHGRTQTPEGDYSMALFADDLFALLQHLRIDNVCLVGYSMGGRIGLNFALKHPEMTAGLVFANSGVMGPDMQVSSEDVKRMEEQRARMVEILQTGDIGVIAEVMARLSLSPGFEEREPEIFRMYTSIKKINDPHHYVPIIQAIMSSMENPPDLTRLACPALIIAGEQDGFMSLEVAKSMELAIPDAVLRIFPTGHASAIEAPAAFNETVTAFLNRIWPL
ncbi:MAG: alpha/beta fold hydrolase [Desulfobacterales bacterium]